MARNLADAWSWIDKIVRRLSRLESGAMLENASITSGRLRIIGGTLRVDSGGSVIIVGTLSIDGTSTVTGTFKVTGPWRLEGDGVITGNVSITGNVTSTGTLTQNGPWNLNGAGKIAGNVDVTGILALLGGGKINVGGMVIDPAGGGSVAFPGGAKLDADPGGGIRLTVGTNRVFVGANLVSMQMGSRSISISASGIQMSGLDTIPSSLAGGASPGTIWTDGNEFFRVV